MGAKKHFEFDMMLRTKEAETWQAIRHLNTGVRAMK